MTADRTNTSAAVPSAPLHIVLPTRKKETVAALREALSSQQKLEIEGRHWSIMGWSDMPNMVPSGFILFTLQEIQDPPAIPFDPWKAGAV